MTESTKQLLEFIKKDYTINDIAAALNISHKQLYYRLFLLKNQGYNFKKNYHANGETILTTSKTQDLNINNNIDSIDIITEKHSTEFRALVISDIHLGSKNDNIESLYKIYDYALENGIHNIINCGDLIDGNGGRGVSPRITDLSEQIDYLVENYPFDKNILNYTVLGNHDISPLENLGQNLKHVLENRRLDIIPIGYDKGYINVKDAKIGLSHSIEKVDKKSYKPDFSLQGHSHKSKICYAPRLTIYVPSLSNLNVENGFLSVPQALDMKLCFNNKRLSQIHIKQLLIDDNVFIINDFNTGITSQSSCDYDESNIVNELPKSSITPSSENAAKVRTRQSQTDKFNQKYGQFIK